MCYTIAMRLPSRDMNAYEIHGWLSNVVGHDHIWNATPDGSAVVVRSDQPSVRVEMRRMQQHAVGARLRFCLKASPYKSTRGKKTSLKTQAEIVGWLADRAAPGGFELERCEAERFESVTVSKRRGGGDQSFGFTLVKYTGVLVVTDQTAFETTMAKGLGRMRAWGAGMMIVEEMV